jgi:hypothetical protein
VELIDLDGASVGTLPGFELAGNPGAPGVWMRRGEQFYLLSLDQRALMPVSAVEGRAVFEYEGPTMPALPTIAGPGHVRYTVESVSGIVLLQWSGECEAATAYWIDRSGPAQILTGESDLASAPESTALGWSSDGDAIALVGGGSCRPNPDLPGIYRYSAPGSGELLYETVADGPVLADAWGTGI